MRTTVVILLAAAISFFFGGPFTFLTTRLAMGVGDDSILVSAITSGAGFLIVMLAAVWRALYNYQEKNIALWVSAAVPALCTIAAVAITDGPIIIGLFVGFLCSCCVPLVFG